MLRRLSCSCRQFRRQHVEYVDGFLSDEAQRTCHAHVRECSRCAQHDVQVRRSLLALQALPVIKPSAEFHHRLCERLSQETLRYASARPLRLAPMMARAPEAPAAILAPREPATITTANSTARFEALSGQTPAPFVMLMTRRPGVRLQSVNYIGQ